VKVRSATNCENYDAKMYQREDGWLKYVVQAEAKYPFPITLYYKDPMVDVSTFFFSPTNGEGFDFGLMLISG